MKNDRRTEASAGPAGEAEFICLCMAPAVDATVRLGRAPRGEGEIFKDADVAETPGGKALNVARWLALRGARAACGGLLGTGNDGPFAAELARFGVADRFVRVPGPTRRNEAVVWPGGSFKVNQAAFPALANRPEWRNGAFGERVLAALVPPRRTRRRRIAVLSGSLPRGCPPSFYADCVRRLRAAGAVAVLDASGEALSRGLAAGPDLVKPNAEECAALVGFVPKTPAAFRRATRLLRAKAAHAIVSDGARGAWFDGAFVPAPRVEVLDPTAAGDTLLAEYCFRVFGKGSDPATAARWAVAAGSAACTTPGGEPPPARLVEALFRETPPPA